MILVALSLGAACNDSPVHPAADAARPADASQVDSSIPGDAAMSMIDAEPGPSCNLAITVQIPGGGPIALGVLCDDVYACMPNLVQAQALMMAAPDFSCVPGPAGPCIAGQYACSFLPSIVDEAELAEICAVTVLPMPPAEVRCTVYL